MHIAQMREVEQIVIDQLVIGIIGELAGQHQPIEIAVVQCSGNEQRVGERRIAHPDPYPAIPLDDRVAADDCG
jgi:hypothetical protein